MEKENKLRFAMLFSAGKDSAMALNRMIEAGHIPVCLVVAVHTSGFTHMHAMRPRLIDRYGEALGLPIVRVHMQEKYDFTVWREALGKIIAEYGVQALCSGDIAFEYSRDNLRRLAEQNGLELFTPLWAVGEEELIDEISKFRIIIKSLAGSLELDELLGKELTPENIGLLHSRGLRLSEDTSDLHTIAVDGPIFSHPIEYRLGKPMKAGGNAMIDVF